MRRTTLAIPLALLACRSAPRPTTVSTTPPPAAALPPATEDPARVFAAARELPEMPTCEATDALALARTTAGVAAAPTVARRADGGLVAYIATPEGERAPRVMLIALDAEGRPAGGSAIALLDAGDAPAHPSLAATREGYLLAWRSGAPGRQQVRVRAVSVRGAPEGNARVLDAVGYVGAVTLTVRDGVPVVAYAHRADRAPDAGSADETPWATSVRVHLGDRAVRVDAPPGGEFTGEAPRVTFAPEGTRVWALSGRANAARADEHALLTRRVDVDDPLRLVARDLDHVDALALADRTLLTWRARVARRDTALRVARVRDDGGAEEPPLTLATFRGAADLRGEIVPLGSAGFAVLNIAALADDANGSVNVSFVGPDGVPVGRAPALTSVLVRSARAAVAAPPEGAAEPTGWAVLDGRDSADGHPALLLTRFGCDPRRPAPRLDVHPGTWPQELAAPDPAPVDIARVEASPAAMSCETRATRPWAPHASGQDDAMRGTSAAVVLGPGGAQLWAVVRTAQGRDRLVTSTLNAQGVVTPPRTVREGEVSLPPTARPLDAMVPAARRREGDIVSDAVREGALTVALLARPDALSADVAQTVALDAGNTTDPFADPLGHPAGRVLFGPSRREEPGARAMLFTDRNVLRRSEIIDGVARGPTSLLQLYPGGGALLAGAGGGARRWLALATGDPGDGRNVGAVTLAAVEASGVRGATRLFPEDGSVIPQGVAMAAEGDRVVLLFPRAEQGGTVTWTWADLRCAVPGGAR